MLQRFECLTLEHIDEVLGAHTKIQGPAQVFRAQGQISQFPYLKFYSLNCGDLVTIAKSCCVSSQQVAPFQNYWGSHRRSMLLFPDVNAWRDRSTSTPSIDQLYCAAAA